MLCDFCGQNAATVHITRQMAMAGKKNAVHLYEACSKAEGKGDRSGFSLIKLLESRCKLGQSGR